MALRRYAERGKGLAQRSKATAVHRSTQRCRVKLGKTKAMRGNQRIAKAVDCTALNGSAKAEHTPSMQSKGIAVCRTD